MRIPDEQLHLFEQRLEAIGLDRRHFLKAVGAMAAIGGWGFLTEAQAAKPSRPAPGEKLAKDQVLRYGGGGYHPTGPSSHDFNKDLYCSGHVALFAGLMVFNADFVAEPWMASEVKPNKDGSVWTFTMRKDSGWSDNSPVTARDFEWSFKRQLQPRDQGPLCLVPLRHQDRRGLQQEAADRREPGRRQGAQRLGAGSHARGPARVLPGAGGIPRRASLPSRRRREARRQVDGGRQHRHQRRLHARGVGHNKQMVLHRDQQSQGGY